MEKKKPLNSLLLSETADIPSSVSECINKTDVHFYLTNYTDRVDLPKDVDLIVVFGEDDLVKPLHSLRLKLQEPLIPVVWFHRKENKVIREVADFSVCVEKEHPDPEVILNGAKKILRILRVFQPLDKYQTPLAIDKVRVLRYMVSREKETLTPFPAEHFKYGFDYPSVLTVIESEPFELLPKMAVDELLDRNFYDTVNLCPNCKSSHINLKEVCPECKSSNLRVEDYIHHFRCGYLAPESDFREEDTDKLVCPKCGRELRHIGVDYDKPSRAFICNECGKIFEDPEKVFFCFNCGETFRTDEVKKFTVWNFIITRYGRDVAFSGSLSNVYMRSILEGDSRILPFSMFKMMLELERKRSLRYGSKSCLLDLDLSSEKIPPAVLYEMIRDVMNLLKLNLRETDIITVSNGHILILLFGTPCKGVSSLMERIKKKLGIFTVIKNGIAEVKFTFAEVK